MIMTSYHNDNTNKNKDRQGCLVEVGNDIELDAVCRPFEPYRRRPCGVTWHVPNRRSNKAAANLRLEDRHSRPETGTD